jgi:hypothetical protein
MLNALDTLNSKPCSHQAVRLARGHFFFCTRPSNKSYVQNRHKQVFFETKKNLHSANFQATIQAAGFLQVPPKPSFKKLLLGTGLWQHANISTSLKSPNGLKNAKCEKGQLSNWPPILYVPETDIIMPKEEPQVFKVKLLDKSHPSMPIYSRGNNKEYFAHIFAVLQIIDQKELSKKCRMLAKAVTRQPEALKNLQEAAGSQETISTNVDVTACKVEIEQTQQMLKEAQKVHKKAIAETYKQLRNLLCGDAQSQWINELLNKSS